MMAILQQDWDHFMNQARVRLPGASEAGLKGELFDVLKQFFRDSLSWTEQITLSIQANVTEYTVTPAEGGVIFELAGVLDANNVPQPALLASTDTITLQNTPDSSATFTATVIKTVGLPTSRDMVPVAPDWLFPLYHLVILDGLIGRMMMQPQKPYSDERKAALALREFSAGCAIAKAQTLRRNTMGSQAWTFPQSFRTRTQRGAVSVGNAASFGSTTSG